MGIFDPIADVDSKRQDQRVSPGRYIMEIRALKVGPSKKTPGVNFFAAEFLITKSQGPEALPVDDPCAWATMLNSQFAFRDVKNLVASILAIPEDELTSEMVDQAVEENGEAVLGEKVFCVAERNDKGYVDLFFRPEDEANFGE